MSKNNNSYFKYVFWLGLFTSFTLFLFNPWSTPFKTLNTIYPYYDYIIIGAGTAGCVVASRLSEIPGINVLLIEAGGDFGYLSNVPIVPTLMQKGVNDWSFSSTSQRYSSFGLIDKKQFIPRGKGLGGSGRLNYFVHGLGIPEDYEQWVDMGASGWSYDNLEPFMKNSFDFVTSKSYTKNITNEEITKIKISDIEKKLKDIANIFIQAVQNNLKYFAAPLYHTIYNGQRESSYKSYILPRLQKHNLHVLPKALVTKINFKNKRAYNLEIFQNDNKRNIMALNEIVISCGAFKTPQLLMLSGIGPQEELTEQHIEIVSPLYGVGKNLHDHLNMPLYVTIEKPLSVTLDKILSLQSLFDYFWSGKGYFSSPGVVAYARGPKHSSVVLFAMGSTNEDLLKYIANTETQTFRDFFPFYSNSSQEGIVLLSSCFQPKSRGTVTLQSNDPNDPPIIDPNYLSQKDDVDCIISGMRLVMDLVNTVQFKNIGAKIHWPKIKNCLNKWTNDINNEYLECIIRHGALTGHHAAGTCSMAGDFPVVNPNLQVLGVERLRVVDASIMPAPISSYPNSIIVAMAERAAKIIKEKPS